MRLRFSATIIEWRGPSPYFYAPLPPEAAEKVRAEARVVSYGWGVIPVRAVIDGVEFTTSLFPRDGTYLLPLKDAVRKRLNVTVDDRISVEITLGR